MYFLSHHEASTDLDCFQPSFYHGHHQTSKIYGVRSQKSICWSSCRWVGWWSPKISTSRKPGFWHNRMLSWLCFEESPSQCTSMFFLPIWNPRLLSGEIWCQLCHSWLPLQLPHHASRHLLASLADIRNMPKIGTSNTYLFFWLTVDFYQNQYDSKHSRQWSLTIMGVSSFNFL